MARTALVGQIAQESILICSIVIKGQVTAGFKCHGGHTLYHVISQIVETSPLQTLGVKSHTETRVRSQCWQWRLPEHMTCVSHPSPPPSLPELHDKSVSASPPHIHFTVQMGLPPAPCHHLGVRLIFCPDRQWWSSGVL